MTLEEENRLLRQCIKNDTETEEDAKKIALRVLTEFEVYGDSYGVPTLADIVEGLVEKAGYTCPQCHLTSHHPRDIEFHYCGNCRQFESEMYENQAKAKPE